MKERIVRFFKSILELFHEAPPPPKISPWVIMAIVAKRFKIDKGWIGSPSRKKKYAIPRHVYFYLCRKLSTLTLQDIAETARRKNHSTVLHGIGATERRMQEDSELADKVAQIEEKFLRLNEG